MSLIVKVAPDSDLYIEWSMVADAPARAGTREEFLAEGEDPARLQRVDERGSSSYVGEYWWDDTLLIVQDLWGKRGYVGVRRSNLTKLAEQLDTTDPLDGITEALEH
jgi:hypothetical protein